MYSDIPARSESGRGAAQDPLLTLTEAAAELRISKKTLSNWLCKGTDLPFTRIGRRPLFYLSDIQAYKARNYTGSQKAA